MVFKDNVDIYSIKKVRDGYGGHEEKEIFIKTIPCKLSSMTTEKQQVYFGGLSRTALSLVTKDRVEYNQLIKIDNVLYEIIRVQFVFNKYIVDLEVTGV